MGLDFTELQRWIVPWLLVSLRVGVAFSLLPAPFGGGAPTRIRAAAGLLVGWALTLSTPWPADPSATEAMLRPVWLLRAAVGEVLLGGVVGLTARVVLAVAEMAGSWMGFSAGLGFAQSVDPTFGESTTPPARAMSALAAVVFFALEGHHTVMRALGATLRLAPPGASFGAFSPAGVLSIGSAMMARGLQMAAPVVATLFLVQVGTAFVSRAAPRIQLFALTFAIAAGVGLAVLDLAAPAMAPSYAEAVRRLPADLDRAFGVLP